MRLAWARVCVRRCVRVPAGIYPSTSAHQEGADAGQFPRLHTSHPHLAIKQSHHMPILIIALLFTVTLRCVRAVATMPCYMLDRPGLKMAQSSAKEAGVDDDGVEYRAILATLVR